MQTTVDRDERIMVAERLMAGVCDTGDDGRLEPTGEQVNRWIAAGYRFAVTAVPECLTTGELVRCRGGRVGIREGESAGEIAAAQRYTIEQCLHAGWSLFSHEIETGDGWQSSVVCFHQEERAA